MALRWLADRKINIVEQISDQGWMRRAALRAAKGGSRADGPEGPC